MRAAHLWLLLAVAALIAVAPLCLPLMAGPPSPQEAVAAAVARGEADLRKQVGAAYRAKAERADRVLSGSAVQGDVMALAAEAAARGADETPIAIATLHASRRDRYVAGLARIDGASVRAMLALANGEAPDAALAALTREIEAAKASLPAVE